MAFWIIYYIVKRVKCNFFAFYYFALLPYVFQQRQYHQVFFKYFCIPMSFFIILSLVYYIIVRRDKLQFSIVIKPFVVFLVYIVASGIIMHGNTNFYIGIRNLIFFSSVVFSLYYILAESNEEVQKIAQINVISIFLCTIIDTAIYYSIYRSIYRASGPLIGMNECAQMAILYLFFASSDKKEHCLRDYALAFVTMGTILLTGSNGGLLAIIIWISISLSLFAPIKKYLVKLVVFVLVGGMIVLLGLRYFKPLLFANLFASQSDRIVLWAIFMNVFKTRPFFGLGYNMVNSVAYKYIYDMGAAGEKYERFLSKAIQEGQTLAAHNDFLKILSETGLVGALLFIILLLAVFKICMQLPQKNQTLFISFIFFFFVHNIMQDSRVWLFLFAITVYSRRKEFNNIESCLAIKV